MYFGDESCCDEKTAFSTSSEFEINPPNKFLVEMENPFKGDDWPCNETVSLKSSFPSTSSVWEEENKLEREYLQRAIVQAPPSSLLPLFDVCNSGQEWHQQQEMDDSRSIQTNECIPDDSDSIRIKEEESEMEEGEEWSAFVEAKPPQTPPQPSSILSSHKNLAQHSSSDSAYWSRASFDLNQLKLAATTAAASVSTAIIVQPNLDSSDNYTYYPSSSTPYSLLQKKRNGNDDGDDGVDRIFHGNHLSIEKHPNVMVTSSTPFSFFGWILKKAPPAGKISPPQTIHLLD